MIYQFSVLNCLLQTKIRTLSQTTKDTQLLLISLEIVHTRTDYTPSCTSSGCKLQQCKVSSISVLQLRRSCT